MPKEELTAPQRTNPVGFVGNRDIFKEFVGQSTVDNLPQAHINNNDAIIIMTTDLMCVIIKITMVITTIQMMLGVILTMAHIAKTMYFIILNVLMIFTDRVKIIIIILRTINLSMHIIIFRQILV